MKKYYVAYYVSRNKVAAMDVNSGCAFAADNPGEFFINSNQKIVSDWIKNCNYGKSSSDLEYLSLRVFNYSLSLD